MKSSTQVFASLVAALATLSQSAVATPSSRAISQNAIDSYQLTGKKITLPSKIELQPLSLVAQQSDICKAGTIPVRINAPDNATPAYSGTLQPGVNSGTRCVFFKDVSLSIRANSKSKTWLIIHGWLNNSESTEIKALALEVARQNPGDRVLMLDWGEAARNGGNTQVPKVGDVGSLGVYYAASWIRPIAEAVVDKLKSDYGLTEQEASQNLNIVGHSLGTLMAGEIGAVYSGMNPKGEKEKGGSPINAIIALDPASETSTALNLGGYDVDGRTPAYTFKGKNFLGASQRDPHPEAIDRPKRFSQVSRFSRAFVGAKSLAGNQEFASWAHESFQMDFGNKFDTGDEHGRVVQAFTNLVSQHPFKQANSKNNFLDLNDMRVHNDCETKGSSYFMKCNTVDGKHEGTVEVNSSNLPTLVKFTTSSGQVQQIAATQRTPTPIKDKTPRVPARFPDEPSSMPVSSTPKQFSPSLKKAIVSRVILEFPNINLENWGMYKPPFSFAEVDLNNDGKKETIVLYRLRKCSNRSCSIEIFKSSNQKNSYNFVSEIGTSRDGLELALLPTKSYGWQDLAIKYFSYETRTIDWYAVKFDGKTYKWSDQKLAQVPKNIILSEESPAFDLGNFPVVQTAASKPSISTSDGEDKCLIPTLPGIDVSNVKIVKNISSRDEKIEQYIRKTHADALNYKGSISYAYNKVDLDGDGKLEVLVRILSSFCGSGGCPVDILKLNKDEYLAIDTSGLSWGRYIVTSNQTNGFKDIFYPHFIRNEKMYLLLKSSKQGSYQKVKEYTTNLRVKGTAYLVCGKYLSFSK